jgi:integrase
MTHTTKTSVVCKLTKAAVDKTKPATVNGKTRQRLYMDSELKGFGLCVGSKTRTFFAQREVRGKSVRITIGRYGVYTVHQARAEARELLMRMSKGEDIRETRRQEQSLGITLREALELNEEGLKAKRRSPHTIAGYRNFIEKYLKDWLDKALVEIPRADARAMHRKIAKDVAAGKYATVKTRHGSYKKKRSAGDGQSTANATFRAFRAVWNRAMKEHEHLPACPAISVDWFKEGRRTTIIPSDQMPRWYAELRSLPNPLHRDYLLALLFTGLRRTSAAEIKWEHVDLEQRTLFIPNPKGGEERAFTLPLSDYLTDLFTARKKQNAEFFPSSVYAFPAVSQTGHIVSPNLSSMTVTFSLHDLRRVFITAAESLNLSPYVIKLLANHAVPKSDVTGGYIQAETERLRVPMQQITDKLLALCTPKTDNVVPISATSARQE